MLFQINKQLIRRDLKLKLKIQTLKSFKQVQFIDWFSSIIYGDTSKENQQIEYMTEDEKKQRMNFLKQNFDNLMKKRQLIELLFYVMVQNVQNTSEIEQNKNDQRKQMTEITKVKKNFIFEAKSFLIGIIQYNSRLIKELYYIIESNSQLGHIHLKPSYYTFLYDLITQIDQKSKCQLNDDKIHVSQCWEFFIDQLTLWWSVTKDYLITTKYCYFRYNLLAFFIQKANKELFLSYKDGILVARISSGIQKRLIEPKYHKAAVLIWAKFAKLLDLDTELDLQQEVLYFEVEQLSQELRQNHKFVDKNQSAKEIEASMNHPLQNQIQNDDEKTLTTEVKQKDQNDSQEEDQFVQVKIKAPQTLQDCILALQNPLRCKIGLKQLKKLIKTQQEDLIFVWKNLLKCLLHPLTEQKGQILKDLLVARPIEWIEDVEEMFFKKDSGMNEKNILIETIEAAVNQLSSSPSQNLKEVEEKGDFYFKRITSKYYTEKPAPKQKSSSNSRRWGHTRIAYEENLKNKNQSVSSLLIVGGNDPYLNRLYPIITKLFFKIIIKMIPHSQKSLLANPLLTQRILNLIGTIANNITNYIDKYLILEQILLIVGKILSYIQQQNQKQKTQNPIIFSEPNWDSKNISTIIMSSIQVLNKVILSIDKYLPDMIMLNLKDCVLKLKKIDAYGIRPLIEMLESNIFNKIH